MLEGSTTRHRQGCMVCGSELVYGTEQRTFQCWYCGQEFTGTIYCPQGHAICDKCHRAGALEILEAIVRRTDATDPIRLAQEIMATPAFSMHGPEHHALVPAVLLAALRNLGVPVTDRQMATALARGSQLPGGICGNWGACGAALGAGIGLSVARGLHSLKREEWGQTNRDTGAILGRVAAYGGPRCCKRTTFTALRAAVEVLERDGAAKFPASAHELPVCQDFWRNKECLKLDCPYYPRPKHQEGPS